MRHHLLSHGRTVKVLVESALSNGRGVTRYNQVATRCDCFRKQISPQSTLNPQPLGKDLLRRKPTNPVAQEDTSIPASGVGLPTLLDNEVLSKARTVLQSSTVPGAALVEETLQACERFATILAEEVQPGAQEVGAEHSPASNLLSLEEGQNRPKSQGRKEDPLSGPAKSAAAQLVSSTAYRVITDPKVYITPKVLSIYVNVQSLLGRPRSLPEVFDLYAFKHIPKPNSEPIRYTTPYPNKPSAHIPLSIAKTALAATIKNKELPLCFDIINASVCAPAYRVSKFFRKAFIPLSGAVLAPFAIYKLSAELSTYQSTMDSAMATQVLFAGILAYVGFTATIGVVAVTTANDQMDRVTWATGTPLRERWMREEERMLIDRVAGAWGFQQRWRRGEEEGQDWEALREWIGMRGMVLDKTELMDGME